MKEDWRIEYYNGHLNGKTFQFAKFKSTKTNNHEHCEFCWKTITDVPDVIECDREGYWLLNEKSMQTNWVCKDCFEEFRDRFNFKVKEPLPDIQ